jgi:hypothetical protein
MNNYIKENPETWNSELEKVGFWSTK